MKAECNKCEWHCLKKGSEYNWRTNRTIHNIDIDACIHPILDDLGTEDHNGNKQYRVTECEDRNAECKCESFQVKRNTFRIILDMIKGKKWKDLVTVDQS